MPTANMFAERNALQIYTSAIEFETKKKLANDIASKFALSAGMDCGGG
jgi:hypothetical protein